MNDYECKNGKMHIVKVKKQSTHESCECATCNNKWIIPVKDNINKPSHYTNGKYETIDIIKDQVDCYRSYLHGNIIKYISRYRHKNGIEDLKKAAVYLEWLIKECDI